MFSKHESASGRKPSGPGGRFTTKCAGKSPLRPPKMDASEARLLTPSSAPQSGMEVRGVKPFCVRGVKRARAEGRSSGAEHEAGVGGAPGALSGVLLPGPVCNSQTPAVHTGLAWPPCPSACWLAALLAPPGASKQIASLCRAKALNCSKDRDCGELVNAAPGLGARRLAEGRRLAGNASRELLKNCSVDGRQPRESAGD